MFEMYNPKYVEEEQRKYQMYMEDIAFGREGGMTEEKIKETLVKRQGICTYAQNLLDVDMSAHVIDAM